MGFQSICLICSNKALIDDTGNGAREYECSVCGIYNVTKAGRYKIEDYKNKKLFEPGKVSHVLRTASENGNVYNLSSKAIDSILKRQNSSVSEQVDNFIRCLGKNQKEPGKYIRINRTNIWALVGCVSKDSLDFIIEYLEKEELIDRYNEIDFSGENFRLSFNGWSHFNNLENHRNNYRKAFMAMSFSNKTLLKIFNDCMKESVNQTGFNLIKLDENKKAGSIDDKLRVEIQTSDFMIADLSDDNSGAYWEAGYAEGLGIPVIYFCEQEKFDKKSTHFDTNHLHTVIWNKEKIHEAMDNLKATIRATLPHLAKMEN